MKQFLFGISFFLLIPVTSWSQDSLSRAHLVFWSEDRQLSWTDFDRLNERYSEHAAYSVVGYEGSLSITDQKYQATVRTYFNKNESWTKTWTATLLMHEQTHFDIAEVYARKFRKKIIAAMEENRLDVELFKTLNQETQEQLDEAQRRYDEATNFSMDYRAQQEWTKKIKNTLQELSSFSNPDIAINRRKN